jgi:hypothetical protein
MNLLLRIGLVVTCVILILSALLIVLVGLLSSTSAAPLLQLADGDADHEAGDLLNHDQGFLTDGR